LGSGYGRIAGGNLVGRMGRKIVWEERREVLASWKTAWKQRSAYCLGTAPSGPLIAALVVDLELGQRNENYRKRKSLETGLRIWVLVWQSCVSGNIAWGGASVMPLRACSGPHLLFIAQGTVQPLRRIG